MERPATPHPDCAECREHPGLPAAPPAYYPRQELVYRMLAPVYDYFVRPHVLPAIGAGLALLGSVEGQDVLDAGTGTGNLALALADAGARVTGLDLSPSLLRMAIRKPGASRVTWLRGDAASLPFADGAFAYAAASMVLHEMPGAVRDRALAELVRVSRLGLLLIDYARGGPPRRGTRWLEAVEGSHYLSYLDYGLEAVLHRLRLAALVRQQIGQFEILVARRAGTVIASTP